MSKEIPWIQTYPYLPDGYNYPDDVPGPLPTGVSEAELDALLAAGATFETHFDEPNPFTAPTTMKIRIGNKLFMTKMQAFSLEDMYVNPDVMMAEIDKVVGDLLRAALTDLTVFGHDGKSA